MLKDRSPDLLFIAKAARWVGADVPHDKSSKVAIRKMAKGFQWSHQISKITNKFIKHELGGRNNFIAVHERWDPTTPGLFQGKKLNE